MLTLVVHMRIWNMKKVLHGWPFPRSQYYVLQDYLSKTCTCVLLSYDLHRGLRPRFCLIMTAGTAVGHTIFSFTEMILAERAQA